MASHIRMFSCCVSRTVSVGLQPKQKLGQLMLRSASSSSSSGVLNSFRGKLVGLVAGGVAAGSLYGYMYRDTGGRPSGKTTTVNYQMEAPPPVFKHSREIRNPADETGLQITLYQFQTCPFCCKVRAFLDYFGFNYNVVEVNSVLRTQLKWSEYKKVPIVVIQYGGKVLQLNDSTLIVSAMYSLLATKKELTNVLEGYPSYRYTDPADKKEKLDIGNKYFLMYDQCVDSRVIQENLQLPMYRTKEDLADERKWRKWTDDVFIHTLSPNVYRTMQESLETFKWFDKAGDWEKHFQTWERYLVIYVGAAAMWIIGKNLKKRHNLKDDVRISLYDEARYWVKSIKKRNTTFMGGETPNLADLSVFGVLCAIEGCEAFNDLRANTDIGPWFDSMKEVAKNKQGQVLLSK